MFERLYAAWQRLLEGLLRARDAAARLVGCHPARPDSPLWFFCFNAALLACTVLAMTYEAWWLVLALGLFALVLLLSAYSAWGANEARRGRIAKKIEEMPAEPLPDLLWVAASAGLLTTVYLPALLQAVHGCFGAYQVRGETTLADWAVYLAKKTILRSLGEGEKTPLIEARPGWGGHVDRGLVMLAYFTVVVTLVQAVGRVWQVLRDVSEGVEGVKKDPDMAVRLGRRAVGPLVALWHQPGLTRAHRVHVVVALGRIGDPAAYPVLQEAAGKDQWPVAQKAALVALARLGNAKEGKALRDEILGLFRDVLYQKDKQWGEQARRGAAAGLGLLDCPEVGDLLLEILRLISRVEPTGDGQELTRQSVEPNVRKEIIRSVGRHLARRRRRAWMKEAEDEAAVKAWAEEAVNYLLEDRARKVPGLLEDEYLRVRNQTARTLARLGNARALGPMVARLRDPLSQNPLLVADTITALGRLTERLLRRPGRLGRPEALMSVEEISRHMRESPNESIRASAAAALGRAGPALAGPHGDIAGVVLVALQEQYVEALQQGKGELARKVARASRRIARVLNQAERVKQQLREAEERYGAAGLERRRRELVQKGELVARIAAAEHFGKSLDVRGLPALESALAGLRGGELAMAERRLKEACEAARAAILGMLVRVASEANEPAWKRLRAAQDLGRHGGRAERAALRQILLGAMPDEVRAAVGAAAEKIEGRGG